MIKKIIFIFLVAAIAYYAGSEGITPKNIQNWLEEKKFTQTLINTLNKSLKFNNESMSIQEHKK